jgi:hypothetical protein
LGDALELAAVASGNGDAGSAGDEKFSGGFAEA